MFGVFIRCRPLLRSELAQGNARYPHRKDTSFSCVRIDQQKSSSSSSSSSPSESLYIGLSAPKKQQQHQEDATKVSTIHVLDPDAVIGPAVRCCALHNDTVDQSSQQRCIFERGFESDGVFGPSSTNSDIYNTIVRPLIDERDGGALYGISGCIFAHGVTSSGKTWTVFGGDNDPGIVEYAVRELCNVSFFAKSSSSAASKAAAAAAAPTTTTTTTVHVSFVEIYNERVLDLLAHSTEQQKQQQQQQSEQRQDFVVSSADYARQVLALPSDAHVVELSEHPTKGTVVSNATEMLVTSEQQIHSLLALGRGRRTSASTAANERSSRSHAVVTLTISRRRKSNNNNGAAAAVAGDTSTARLTFVDLAGSERSDASVFAEVAATEARLNGVGGTASPNRSKQQQARFNKDNSSSSNNSNQKAALVSERLRREGSNINKSLFALGACIAALAKQSAGRAAGWSDERVAGILVPYRNSKLTRLLSDSLGGNTRTVILATVSPSVLSYSETLATLRFAETARTVSRQSAVRANRSKDASGEAMRQLYKKELQTLQQEVAALRSITSDNAAKIQQREQLQHHKKKERERAGQQELEEGEERQRLNQQRRQQQQQPATAEHSGQHQQQDDAMRPFPSFFVKQQQQQEPQPTTTTTASAAVRTLKSFLLEEPVDEAPQNHVAPAAAAKQPSRRRSPSVSFVPAEATDDNEKINRLSQESRRSVSTVAHGRQSNSIGPETVVGESQSEMRSRQLDVDSPSPKKQQQQQQPAALSSSSSSSSLLSFFPATKAIKLCDLMLKGDEEIAQQQQQQEQLKPAWAPSSSIFLASPAAVANRANGIQQQHQSPPPPSWAASKRVDGQQQQQQHHHKILTSPFVTCSSSPAAAAASPSPRITARAEERVVGEQQEEPSGSTPLLRVKEILERERMMRLEKGMGMPSFLAGPPRWAGEL